MSVSRFQCSGADGTEQPCLRVRWCVVALIAIGTASPTVTVGNSCWIGLSVRVGTALLRYSYQMAPRCIPLAGLVCADGCSREKGASSRGKARRSFGGRATSNVKAESSLHHRLASYRQVACTCLEGSPSPARTRERGRECLKPALLIAPTDKDEVWMSSTPKSKI